MPLNDKDLERILAMDDASFAALVAEIARAAGGDEKRVRELSAGAPEFKKALAGMSVSKAESLLKRAGRGKSEAIMDALRKNGYGK